MALTPTETRAALVALVAKWRDVAHACTATGLAAAFMTCADALEEQVAAFYAADASKSLQNSEIASKSGTHLAALAQPGAGESAAEDDSDPLVKCPSCGCCNDASVSNREDVVEHLYKGPIPCVVPVWTCHACDFSWTGHRSEAIRDAAVAALQSAPAPEPPGAFQQEYDSAAHPFVAAEPSRESVGVGPTMRALWDAGWNARAESATASGDTVDHWCPSHRKQRERDVLAALRRVQPPQADTPQPSSAQRHGKCPICQNVGELISGAGIWICLPCYREGAAPASTDTGTPEEPKPHTWRIGDD